MPGGEPTSEKTSLFAKSSDVIAVGTALLAIFVAGFGVFDTIIVYGSMVALGITGGMLLKASQDKPMSLLFFFHLLVALTFVWLIWRWISIMLEQEEFFVDISRLDLGLAWLSFAIIGYATWRFFGLPMLLVYLAAILYAWMPEAYGGAGLEWSSLSDRMWFTTDGVFGRPVQVVSTVVLIFIVFGGVLQASGAGEVLLKMAFAATGRFAGGPAHASIVSSAMFGTMSGAPIANVVSTGVFTIPIIKKAGFEPKFAGAVEAAASTGGQIMPPVMGVVAFIMADVTSIPYLQIILAALIPAVFYYLSLFAVVLIEARKQGVTATPKSAREVITLQDWIKSLSFWIPLGVIIAVLLTGRTAQNAGFYALITGTVLSLLFFPKFRNPKAWWNALVVAGRTAGTLMIIIACVGLVIGIVNMTGIGLVFADAIRDLSGESLFFALVLVMIGCLVMGMGVPTVTAYLILALIMGPVLEGLGISKIAAHLFMVYFGVLSVVTPPVALASFAAAPIAGAKPMETSFVAARLALAGFIIPFVFVYYPDLLIIDGFTVPNLLWSTACFLLATWMIATGLARFEMQRLSTAASTLRLVLALIILYPEFWTSLIAGLIAIGLVVQHHRLSGQTLPTTRGENLS